MSSRQLHRREPDLDQLMRQDELDRQVEMALPKPEPMRDLLVATGTGIAGVGSIVSPLLQGMFGILPFGGFLLRGVAGAMSPPHQAAPRTLSIPGERLLDACGLSAQPVRSLAKMERALESDDSYAEVTFGVLRQIERLVRGIFLDGDRPPAVQHEAVLGSVGANRRKYLETVLSRGQPFTLGTTVTWLVGLDEAWNRGAPAVQTWAKQALHTPGHVLGEAELPRSIEPLVTLRNRIAHHGVAVSRSQHTAVCTNTLARSSVSLFVREPILPDTVLVRLMVERAHRCEQH